MSVLFGVPNFQENQNLWKQDFFKFFPNQGTAEVYRGTQA